MEEKKYPIFEDFLIGATPDLLTDFECQLWELEEDEPVEIEGKTKEGIKVETLSKYEALKLTHKIKLRKIMRYHVDVEDFKYALSASASAIERHFFHIHIAYCIECFEKLEGYYPLYGKLYHFGI